MKALAGTLAAGLIFSVALPAGFAAAADPTEQIMLERAGYWRTQNRLDLAGAILNKVLAVNPGQPDALYQQGVLAMQQGDRGGAQQYFDRLRLLAPSDKRAAELASALPQPAVTPSPSSSPAPSHPAPVAAATAPIAVSIPTPGAAASPAPAAPTSAAPPRQIAPFAVASADSDDFAPRHSSHAPAGPAPLAPRRVVVAQVAMLPRETASDVEPPLPAMTASAVRPAGSAGSADLGITARSVQLAQVELEPPPPVSGTTPLGTLRPYSASDTLETYIDRDLAQLEAQSNPTLIAGLGFRGHNGTEGLNSLTEVGAVGQMSFSPWYTGTATITVLPVYVEAGTPQNINLRNFGANPLVAAAGLNYAQAGDQNASGVGLLGSYSLGDFSGQFGTTPLGFPVVNFVGNVAYVPKFLDGTLSVRFEGTRQPVNDSVLSYSGTRANFAAANTIAPGAFGTNTVWGGVVKTGPHVTVFYDNQSWGAYGGAGVAWLTGTNVAQNSEVDALIGAYFRPYKWDWGTLRVGISLFYEGYDKNLGNFTFGQGGYFSPQDFEGLGFPVELTGSTGPWSYLASTTLGVQHFNEHSTAVFPNNPNAQAALEVLAPNNAFFSGVHGGIGFGFNLKGQVEYAVDKSFALGVAGSLNNGNNYDEGIVQLYLRKTFDWFGPSVAFKNDPESIAARDQPMSRL